MQNGGIPIESVRERKFSEARPAIKRAPVRQGGHAFPAVLRGNRGDVHPVSRWYVAIFTALLVNFWIKVITRA